jgi:hypothetical protein
MFEKEQLVIQPHAARVPARLPFSILLCLPNYVTSDPGAAPFNLTAAIARLIGRAGAARAMSVFRPRIWAPGWNNAELQQFITSPFQDRPWLFRDFHPAAFRALDFIPLNESRWPYDIVHFCGFVEERGGFPALDLGESAPGYLRHGALLDALLTARTRLLILQVPKEQFEQTHELAKAIVAGSGPAVMAVVGRDSGTVDRFLLNTYANILHNTSIPEVAQPEPWLEYQQLTVQDLAPEGTQPQGQQSLSVRIVYGDGGRDLLRLDPYVSSLRERLDTAWGQIVANTSGLSQLYQTRQLFLHTSQLRALTDPTLGHNALLPIVTYQRNKLNSIAWHHESEGVIPSSEIDDSIASLESHADGMRELESEAMKPPRVLNASFLEHGGSKALSRSEGLKPASDYDLLVDVGPRKSESLVTGNSEFPESALPPGEQSWRIQVVLVSEDFVPRVTSAFLWVDSSGGPSFPDVNGKKAKESGPVALHVITPQKMASTDKRTQRLRGRLCLYYQNNLLQSAAVNVALAGDGESRDTEPNEIKVDYSLTSNFQDLEKRFATRELDSGDAQSARQPVKLSLTLNDDGSGRHRILVKDHPEVDPAFASYDPDDARRALATARDTLLKCFDGVSEQNGKSRDSFKRDLLRLAQAGRELFQRAFSGVNLQKPGMRSAEWEAELRQALAAGKGVIQVARTGPAQYVFPWTLIYEYPFIGLKKDWRFCRVINELWSEEGVRSRGLDEPVCRYKDEAFHQADVICPYGFWGLKHIIEQPLSALSYTNGQMEFGETPDAVRFQKRIDFAVAVSDDLDPNDMGHKVRDRHLCRLAQTYPIELAPPAPANDFYSVRNMLKSPVVVYFLCHGEYDKLKKTTYLSVGLRDDADEHKIYPTNVQDWKSAHMLDIAGWKKCRPLIFINGCHSVDLTPGEVLNFVTSFADAGASGIVGTEINVQLPLAAAVAEALLNKLAKGEAIGAAMHQIRWDLVNKGNLLGLAYTLNCMANLRVVGDGAA